MMEGTFEMWRRRRMKRRGSVGTVRVKRRSGRRELCGEGSLLKALSCYCNGRPRNATTHCSDQKSEAEGKEKKKRPRE